MAIEFRWAGSQSARLPALAAELVYRQVAVIFTGGFGSPIRAAKAATSTIPIVFAYGGDPVKGGLVASLSHPGGNVTGVTAINAELVSKWLSLAGDLAPIGWGEPEPRNPTTGIAGCCALTMRGHAAAAPASVAMSSRRRMQIAM